MFRRSILGFAEHLISKQLFVVSAAGIYQIVDTSKCSVRVEQPAECSQPSWMNGRCGLEEVGFAGCVSGECCSGAGYCVSSAEECVHHFVAVAPMPMPSMIQLQLQSILWRQWICRLQH